MVCEAAEEGFLEEGAGLRGDGGEGEVDAGLLIGIEVQGDEMISDLGIGNLCPGHELHVFGGPEEGEDFDAEGAEDDVGVSGAVKGGAGEQGGEGGGEQGPEGMGEIGVFVAVAADHGEGEGGGEGHRGGDPERHGLPGPGEAEFLMRFGDWHGD